MAKMEAIPGRDGGYLVLTTWILICQSWSIYCHCQLSSLSIRNNAEYPNGIIPENYQVAIWWQDDNIGAPFVLGWQQSTFTERHTYVGMLLLPTAPQLAPPFKNLCRVRSIIWDLTKSDGGAGERECLGGEREYECCISITERSSNAQRMRRVIKGEWERKLERSLRSRLQKRVWESC